MCLRTDRLAKLKIFLYITYWKIVGAIDVSFFCASGIDITCSVPNLTHFTNTDWVKYYYRDCTENDALQTKW